MGENTLHETSSKYPAPIEAKANDETRARPLRPNESSPVTRNSNMVPEKINSAQKRVRNVSPAHASAASVTTRNSFGKVNRMAG